MSNPIHIVWFRQDLRIEDNAALLKASQMGDVLPIYIQDNHNPGDWTKGAASNAWLHHTLKDLDNSLNGCLNLYIGDPLSVFEDLIERYNISSITWGRCYEPWRITRDTKVKKALSEIPDLNVESVNNSLLWEPWEIKKKDDTPYKVFTPFYRKGCLNATPPHMPYGKPENLNTVKDKQACSLDDLSLLDQKIDWYSSMFTHWDISETGALHKLESFLENGLANYKKGRDEPAKQYVSQLSPYLHFGQISPHKVWHTSRSYAQIDGLEKEVDHFCSELGWREFSYSLLYYNPDLPQKPLQEKFENFMWLEKPDHLKAWQKGLTGYPIIDAGMRQLWQTGYMHNRVRMIVGSFLVKNLLIPWTEGEKWFWDCLFDADLANNAASWQWIAGCGADAAPYFRIFNPVTQGEKFDAKGEYVRKYVPEITNLPDKYIHKPWEAPKDILRNAHIEFGVTYPAPIVDLKPTRERALDAYAKIKNT